MKIIVDANIAFSAILNTHGKIADLLLNSESKLEFIAPNFLRVEIRKHYSKLSKISGLSIANIQEAEFQIYQNIAFVAEELIKSNSWIAAEKLTFDVDINDTPYIAF